MFLEDKGEIFETITKNECWIFYIGEKQENSTCIVESEYPKKVINRKHFESKISDAEVYLILFLLKHISAPLRQRITKITSII